MGLLGGFSAMDSDRRLAAGGISIRFWGTRGSLPRPGPDYVRYGGNTTCVEIRVGKRLFIVDAGSGIADAGKAFMTEAPLSFDILLSHLHHDHISGLPFFPPALNPKCTIRVHCGNLNGESAEAAFDMMFTPPLFPIKLSLLPCNILYHGFQSGAPLVFEDGIVVRTCSLTHPGGATAYRFDHEGRSVCYVSDLEHVPGVVDRALVSFCADADLVIYDTMFNDGEFHACRGWGHSTWGAGVTLCKAARAKALAATHHHIRHTDDVLDEVDAQVKAALPGSFVAREGQSVRLMAKVPEPVC